MIKILQQMAITLFTHIHTNRENRVKTGWDTGIMGSSLNIRVREETQRKHRARYRPGFVTNGCRAIAISVTISVLTQ